MGPDPASAPLAPPSVPDDVDESFAPGVFDDVPESVDGVPEPLSVTGVLPGEASEGCVPETGAFWEDAHPKVQLTPSNRAERRFARLITILQPEIGAVEAHKHVSCRTASRTSSKDIVAAVSRVGQLSLANVNRG